MSGVGQVTMMVVVAVLSCFWVSVGAVSVGGLVCVGGVRMIVPLFGLVGSFSGFVVPGGVVVPVVVKMTVLVAAVF